jgi:tRNA pseudouridine55 synthase
MTNPAPHGVIIVDKPPNATSHTVVTHVKKALAVRKAGHTGTLDPFATGVLPVCINEGTKLSPFLMEQDKEYEGVLLLGLETDTQDCTGRTIRQHAVGGVSDNDIARAFEMFHGPISQIPPMFSAIKHNGAPLYELARQGVEVDRTARKVTIYSLEVVSVELPRIFFRVRCSKGTYVRTLVSDI